MTTHRDRRVCGSCFSSAFSSAALRVFFFKLSNRSECFRFSTGATAATLSLFARRLALLQRAHQRSGQHGGGARIGQARVREVEPLEVGRVQRRHQLRAFEAEPHVVTDSLVAPVIDPKRFTFDQLPHALAHLESREAVGKVVVEVA